MKQGMDNYQLFQRYLEVCNQALEMNKDKFPFKQILLPLKSANPAKAVEVSIIDDHPVDRYTLTVNGEKLVGEIAKPCANCGCGGAWRIQKSYLEDVIAHPEDYINNPAKIDWEWLQG